MSNIQQPESSENVISTQTPNNNRDGPHQTSAGQLIADIRSSINHTEAEVQLKILTLVSSNKNADNDKSNLSRNSRDMCRICHMGSGYPPQVTIARPKWNEWSMQTPSAQAATPGVVDSQISNLSSHTYLGPLISVCKCRGTVALIHVECLERWLTESGHSRCELCGYKYLTKKIPKHGIFQSIWLWFNTVIATRQMVLDILYLVVTTPLALFSIYICSLTVRVILNSGLSEIPLIIIAMLPTCSLTLVAYWTWIITIGRLHGRRWRRFWRNNFVVRLLLPDDPSIIGRQSEEEMNIQSNSGNTIRSLLMADDQYNEEDDDSDDDQVQQEDLFEYLL